MSKIGIRLGEKVIIINLFENNALVNFSASYGTYSVQNIGLVIEDGRALQLDSLTWQLRFAIFAFFNLN